ncbi:suppressor of G2 allele of SKP1 [Nematocida ausubeli]|nr:suppressor of G2 allele of SKP1 [Nematocida ausubeli]
MRHEWYETRETATIIVSPVEEVQEIVKRDDTLSISLPNEVYSIRIVHAYSVQSHRILNKQLEITLKKPVCSKWGHLEHVPILAFERQKEIPNDSKEALSNDPIMNMFMEVYANASDEAKKEMNRSFYESSGTELRTHRTRDTCSKK